MKRFRFLAVFAAVALLGAGCWWIPNMDAREKEFSEITFKQYTNKELGIAFEYPEHWEIFGPDEDSYLKGDYLIVDTENCPAGCGIGIFVRDVDRDFDFDSYAQKTVIDVLDTNPINEKRMVFKSFPAYRSDYTFKHLGVEQFGYAVLFYTGEKVVGISFNGYVQQQEIFEKIFDKILNSLTVTD